MYYISCIQHNVVYNTHKYLTRSFSTDTVNENKTILFLPTDKRQSIKHASGLEVSNYSEQNPGNFNEDPQPPTHPGLSCSLSPPQTASKPFLHCVQPYTLPVQSPFIFFSFICQLFCTLLTRCLAERLFSLHVAKVPDRLW